MSNNLAPTIAADIAAEHEGEMLGFWAMRIHGSSYTERMSPEGVELAYRGLALVFQRIRERSDNPRALAAANRVLPPG